MWIGLAKDFAERCADATECSQVMTWDSTGETAVEVADFGHDAEANQDTTCVR